VRARPSCGAAADDVAVHEPIHQSMAEAFTTAGGVPGTPTAWARLACYSKLADPTDPAGPPQASVSRVRTQLIHKIPSMPSELIGSSEQNWLTGKVLLTAVRAPAIDCLTLRTG
jgi:hypothetical protein